MTVSFQVRPDSKVATMPISSIEKRYGLKVIRRVRGYFEPDARVEKIVLTVDGSSENVTKLLEAARREK